MNILGIGTDIVEIKRVERLYDRYKEQFLHKILSVSEKAQKEYWTGRDLAKRFCVKEAISKALGTGFSQGITMPQMIIKHHASGKPVVELESEALTQFHLIGGKTIHISISDEKQNCISYCIIEG